MDNEIMIKFHVQMALRTTLYELQTQPALNVQSTWAPSAIWRKWLWLK
jgi:hypothetical protein